MSDVKLEKILKALRRLNFDEFNDEQLTNGNSLDDILRELDAFERKYAKRQEKLLHLTEYTIDLASGVFGQPMSISEDEDEFDAFAMSLNALSEELKANTVSIKAFDTVFNALQSPFMMIDCDRGILEQVNQFAFKYFSYQKLNKYQIPIGDLIPKVILKEISKFHKSKLLNSTVEGKFFINESQRNLVIGLAKIDYSLNDKMNVAVLFTDITDQYDKIELKNEKKVLESSIKFKDDFLANMSHEIRTPLNGIVGIADLLSKNEDVKDVHREQVSIIKNASNSLLVIINDILDFSKLSANKMQLINTPLNVADLISDTEHLFSASVTNNKNVSININVDELKHPQVVADKNRINQILNNLLSNAIKFTEYGTISLSVTSKQNIDNLIELKFSIKDTGIGMSKKGQGQLFQQFYQADSGAAKSHQGTGLGLSICKQLSILMGGDIGVTSKLGEGSEFWFTIKAAEYTVEEIKKNHIGNQAFTSEHPLHILLVDDKKSNLIVAELILKTFRCEVTAVDNGLSAIKLAQENKYDLIFLDIQMPKLTGVQVLEILKNTIKNPMPIVALTANAIEGDREKYLSYGFDEYLSKPITLQSVNDLLKKLFD